MVQGRRGWRKGNPTVHIRYINITEIKTRFLSRVKIHEGGCWIWKGATRGNNRGCFAMSGKRYSAHRAAYSLFIGPIPANLLVCHKCDNPICVNPAHLFLGTHQDNMTDMIKKGRSPRTVGEKNGGGKKLKESDVLLIRADSRGSSELASEFGVSRKMIWKIRSGRNWAHLSTR